MHLWKLLTGVTVAAAVLLTGAFAGSAMAGNSAAPGKGGDGTNLSPGQQVYPDGRSPGQDFKIRRLAAAEGVFVPPPGKTFNTPGNPFKAVSP